MKTYRITIALKSDTMMGSGQSIPGVIDNDILYDEYGIPYMNAKTMKGHLGEQMRWIYRLKHDSFKNVSLSELLGSPDTEGIKREGKLRFSTVHLPEAVAGRIRKAVREKVVTKEEILDSLTVPYTYTALDSEGIAEDHTLRRTRMVRGGITFETEIRVENLNDEEEKLLTWGVCALQHIGTCKSKGKGLVQCDIIDTESLRKKYVETEAI